MPQIRRFLCATAIGGLIAGFAAPLAAQEGFSPVEKCNTILTGASPTTKIMVASWMMGFLDGQLGDRRPVSLTEVENLLSVLTDICAANPEESLLAVGQAVVVAQQRKDAGQARAAVQPGSEAEARALLAKFLEPGADVGAMARALQPTQADVRAVYKEPLASNMVRIYDAVFADKIKVYAKPGQTELLMWWTTTDALIRGDAVMRNFPGGYGRVTSYLNPGFPIVRFKFVKPGETVGMAYDGLIFVNGRWVLMPKPWRMLEE